MSDADESLELRLARQARDEAAADRKDAEKDLAEAQYLRAQAARDRAEIAEIERAVGRREEALRAAGEPDEIRREQEATAKLEQARDLLSRYDNDKHGAAIALQQINEREAAAARRA